jgi:vacuolar-type H+-ATPase subunit H
MITDMASEMINEVLRVEKEAADRESAARNRADEIVAAAGNQAKAEAEAKLAEARAEQATVLAEAQKKADEIFAQARKNAQSERSALEDESRKRRGDAVSAVIQYIIP